MTISKSTIIENIYKIFYDDLASLTSFSIYPAFPYKDISSKSSYPIMVLGSPDVNWENLTIKRKKVSGTIDFEINTTDAKTCDEYTSDAINHIETQARNLRTEGLIKVELDDTDKSTDQKGELNIHTKTVIWSFEFVFDKSSMPW